MNAENSSFSALFATNLHFLIGSLKYNCIDTPVKRQNEKNKRLAHCGIILRLLKEKDFVRTAELTRISYNHTARITELRKGRYDGKQYIIKSIKQEGVYGFSLIGYLEVK